ncbi:inhibitor of nuclear factor kappa-B kinase subunit beta-like [Ceratina calcarata]|uniref:IkappaB kinase n=1 Tax=Ceratina calcarata TaxID=156304 RepID=A0AAJ7JGW0_9HYME|nr:inhibitor of nuclear factor kappa-B kinase subunit beta-like [Ceratina calcarata]XP_017892542.1 inhibitor of nuclear factor kappa-B kinase subunit beta-like [Ceratina calcarata]
MTATPKRIQGWVLEKVLGTGGFGSVELWAETSTGAKLAIKICKKDIALLSDAQKERWFKEVQIMKRLNHPNIIKVLELPFAHPDDKIDLPVLCMQFCRQGDLRKVLNNPKNCCGMKERNLMKAMKHISSAVEYLHSYNITHRDLKPENIVLQDERGTISYKLIDLGYAKELGEDSTSGSLVGTLNYVAPELLWQEKYNCSVDYWSLGILFYELVTGIRPFLPGMQHTMTWMQLIRNKGYDDICAFKSEGKVVFGQDISSPTNLSKNLQSKLVDWFKLVLQWHPKRRGKRLTENGLSEVLVFKLLDKILSKEMIYVFSVSEYKVDTYEVDENTTITRLQNMIAEINEFLPVPLQTLTDYHGDVLVENKTPLLSQIKKPILFVFRNETPLTESIPDLDIPVEIRKMIDLSRRKLDIEILQDYYRVTLFFMKQQIYLFKLYMYALTIKADLVIARLKAFYESITKSLTSINSLCNELSKIRVTWEKEESLDDYDKKLKKLVTAANKIKSQFNPSKQENELRTAGETLASIRQNMSDVYDEAAQLYTLCKNERLHFRGAEPIEMVKLVFEFMQAHPIQSHNANVFNIVKQISKLEKDLATYERIFNSVVVITEVYQNKLQDIISTAISDKIDSKKRSNSCVSTQIGDENPDTSNEQKASIEKKQVIDKENDVIYENLIIRYTLDNLMKEMKRYIDAFSLQPQV